MRKFLLRTFLFTVIAIGLIAVFHFSIISTRKKILTLPSNVTTLFLGNSTVECSLNDTIYSNAFNFSRSAELMEYTYTKLKLIHKYNPQIDTIVLGFDDFILRNNNFVPGQTHPFLSDQFTVNNLIIHIKENFFKRNTFISDIFNINKIIIIYESYKLKNIHHLDIGGYRWLIRNKLYQDIEKNSLNNEIIQELSSFPFINIYYLDQIVNYCKINNLELIFLNTPKYYNGWKDSLYIEVHKHKYPDIELIDAMRWTYPDSCYGDIAHLNYKGAKIFSKDLNSLIRHGK